MKIGINLVQYTDVQGIEVFASNILRELVKVERHEYVFFVNERSRGIFDVEGVKLVTVPVGNLSKLSRILAQQTRLPRLLKKEGVDLLFCPSVAVPLWYRKKVVTVHDCAWKRFSEEAGIVSRVYLRLAMASIRYRSLGVVTVSDFAKKELEVLFGIRSATVISEGPPKLPRDEDERILSRLSLVSEKGVKPYFFFVGNFHYRKNLARALEAFRVFLHEYPDFSFVCAGKNTGSGFDAVKRTVDRLGIGERVIFSGFVSDEEKVSLYRNSVALVFPSLYEGFGLPILEAQTLGVPVLAAASSSLLEIAGDAAEFVDPFDIRSIKEGMERIAREGEGRKELIARGRENVKRFSWEKTAEKILSRFAGFMNNETKYENLTGK